MGPVSPFYCKVVLDFPEAANVRERCALLKSAVSQFFEPREPVTLTLQHDGYQDLPWSEAGDRNVQFAQRVVIEGIRKHQSRN